MEVQILSKREKVLTALITVSILAVMTGMALAGSYVLAFRVGH